MKIIIEATKFVPGKVLIGPKIVGSSYYRIVSQRDRSGRIEVFDPASRSWTAAGEDVSFSDLWRAPDAAQLYFDLACASDGVDGEFDEPSEIEPSAEDHDLALDAALADAGELEAMSQP